MKFTMPEPAEPVYPPLPFSDNSSPHIELVANYSALMVVHDGPDTPMHERAAMFQANRCWAEFDRLPSQLHCTDPRAAAKYRWFR